MNKNLLVFVILLAIVFIAVLAFVFIKEAQAEEAGIGIIGTGPNTVPYPSAIMTPSARAVWDDVKAQPQFKNIGHIGAYNCRVIAGSDEPSQHSYGNAIDFTGSFADMALLRDYLMRNAGRLKINYVIFDRQISRQGGALQPYTGVDPHTTHLHADFLPVPQGAPPCSNARMAMSEGD